MNHHTIVGRRVSRSNGRVGFDGVATGRRDVSMPSTFDLVGVRAGENLAAFTLNRSRESSQIFQWMKLRLPRKVQARTRVETFQRRALHAANFDKSRAMGRRQFIFKNFQLAVGRYE